MSNFRNLAPSNQRALDSSDSSISKTGAASSGDVSTKGSSRETTVPKSDGGTGRDEDDDRRVGAQEERVRERRPPGTVAGRACNECRQARQKCNGEKAPSREIQTPCSRCQQRSLKCVFGENTKMQKESLIEELKSVHGHNEELQSDIMRRDIIIRDLSESNDWRGDILRIIGNDRYESEVLQRLKSGQSHQQLAEWLRREVPELVLYAAHSDNYRSLSEVVKVLEADCQDAKGGTLADNLMWSKWPWTDVSTDPRLISRLLDLYFAYVHPVHLLFNEREFRSCFTSGDTAQCSRSLVNAMCAMACFLYEDSPVGDGLLIDFQNTTKMATLRKGFLDAAKICLNASNYKLLTSVQTFAIMYLIDLSSGNARSAQGYLEAALHGLLAIKDSPLSNASKELTYWGVRNLKTFCEGSTYRSMSFSTPKFVVDFKGVDTNQDDENIGQIYYQYGHVDVPRRATFSELTAFHQTKLFRIIENNIRLYCGRPHCMTAEAACSQYKQYVAWEQHLPTRFKEAINIEENTDPPLPHVFYLYVQYHTAVVQHLMPIAQSGFFQDADLEAFRELVVSHAWKGLELLRVAQSIYTSRFSLPLITFCTAFLGDALLVQSSHLGNEPADRSSPEAIKTCLELLQQTRLGFALCGPLQRLLLDRATEYNIALPENMKEVLDCVGQYGVESFLDACSGTSFTQPLDRLLPQIDPRIAKDWSAAWRASQTDRSVKIASLLNAS